MNHPMDPCWHRIRRRIRETADTFTLELEALGPNRPTAFTPGQFNMLYVIGTGEVPISVSGHPGHGKTWLHTIRAYGSVTGKMQSLNRGDIVGLRGPFGQGWPMADLNGQDILLCAGGIGIAPLRPVLYAILARREAFGRVTLLYGERTPADLIYRREIERWRGRLDLDIWVTVDSARQAWRGNVGVVTTLMTHLRIDAVRTYALLCGPEIMMRYAIETLTTMGLAEERIIISMERSMKCGFGLCGHCQLGPLFVCTDGPVFRYPQVIALFQRREC
jgi:NAD(P)H-flavin reductase